MADANPPCCTPPSSTCMHCRTTTCTPTPTPPVENLFARQTRTNASQVVQEATSKAQPIFARQLDALHGRGTQGMVPIPEEEAEMLAATDGGRVQVASSAPAVAAPVVEEDDEAAELQRMREQYLGAARYAHAMTANSTAQQKGGEGCVGVMQHIRYCTLLII